MAKRKKKTTLTMVTLLLALAFLIVFYLWYSNREETSGNEAESKAKITLAEIDKNNIQQLHFQNKEVNLNLYLEGEVWLSQEDPNRPINQDKVDNLLNVIDRVEAERLVLENPEDISEFGLDEPVLFLEATSKDNQVVSLKIGSQTSTKEGYYGMVNDDPNVYLFSNNYRTGMDYRDVDMTEKEDLPSVAAEGVKHLTITMREGDNFELVNDPDNQISAPGALIFPWIIYQPYEEGVIADTAKVNEYLGNYASLVYDHCVNYQAEDLSDYGLDQPYATIHIEYEQTNVITLEEPEVNPETGEEIKQKTEVEDKEFTLLIGDQNDDGDYFVRMVDSDAVYVMDASDVENMLEVDVFAMVSKHINMPNIANVDHITIQVEDSSYTMEIERNTITNEEGEEETEEIYYYNGQVIEEDDFKGIYRRLISAAYDAPIKEELDITGLKPVITISYHIAESDKTVSSSYLPYDESFYIVDNGRKVRFYADKRKIDDIVSAVVVFKPSE